MKKYSQSLIEKIFAELRQKQIDEEVRVHNLLVSLRLNPEFKEVDDKLREVQFNIERAAAKGLDTSIYKTEAEAAEKKRAKLLKSLNVSETSLEFVPSCSKCGGTGHTNGRLCECVSERYVELVKEACSNEAIKHCTFKSFNRKLFVDPEHKKDMLLLKEYFEKYANKYPKINYPNFLLIGSTGTGKSFIVGALANALLDKGLFVKYMTAFDFNQTALKYHTSPLSERAGIFDEILDFDMLILDDLGTEPMLKNVTCEYLYLVLSERQSKNLATVTVTNLGENEILNRYGERIHSRLMNTSTTRSMQIVGADLRVSERNQKKSK